MKVLIQKYGGTSVATIERIRAVATRVAEAKKLGYSVVVVVSAMAGETDRLLKLCSQFRLPPRPQESDVVASTGETVAAALTSLALQELGYPSRSYLGAQLPILTTEKFGEAQIISVDPSLLLESMRLGEIPVVAGYQGINRNGRITTLGRGGSDTTAIAIAAALKGSACEIYTDVDGIYTADPRQVDSARCLPEVSYSFMIAASGLGAKVMHDRSVRMAKKYAVPVVVRSSFTQSLGTEISCRETHSRCIAVDPRFSRVNALKHKGVEPLEQRLKLRNIPFIDHSSVHSKMLELIMPTSALNALDEDTRGNFLFVNQDVARVSVVGDFVQASPSLIGRASFEMNRNGIQHFGSTLGTMSLSQMVPTTQAKLAAQLLHKCFVESDNQKAS